MHFCVSKTSRFFDLDRDDQDQLLKLITYKEVTNPMHGSLSMAFTF